VELAVQEVAFVEASLELEAALSSFLALEEVSSVLDLEVVPAFKAVAVLHIVLPLSSVHTTLQVNEDTETMGFSVEPLTLVDVTVDMSHPALAVVLAVDDLALVKTTIIILHDANALPYVQVVHSPLTAVLALRTIRRLVVWRDVLEIIDPDILFVVILIDTDPLNFIFVKQALCLPLNLCRPLSVQGVTQV